MVVTKSKSHPNLLFYGRRGELNRTTSSGDSCGDSVSSLDFSHEKTARNATGSDDNNVNVIGGLLWKLLLAKEIDVCTSNVSEQDWKDLQAKHWTLSQISISKLQLYHKALTSIVIMDPSVDPRADTLLKEYNGRLINIDDTVTQELRRQAPDTFTAFVADFNDNLAYQMKTSRGFPSQPSTHNRESPSPTEWQEALQQLQDNLQTTLHSTTELEIQGSFLKTEYKTIAQPPHVDIPWKTLQQQQDEIWLGFFGLTREGMILQVWPFAATGKECVGQLVYVPLGKLLLLPSRTIHGGGFRTQPLHNEKGNLRYHLYLATDGSSLPRFANNVYTLPEDCGTELSQVCLNAPYLEGDGDDGTLLVDLLLD